MPAPRVITTPTDLVKYVKHILGDQWTVRVEESQGVEQSRTQQTQKFHHWYLSANCATPISISVYLFEKTLPALIKAVHQRLWEKIRDEFQKKSVHWQTPADHDVIGTRQRRLERKRPALTQQPVALPAPAQPSKQLSLLPPGESQQPRCHWPGCSVAVHHEAWACRAHWQRLTPELQDLISQQYRPGKIQSGEYSRIEEVVFAWINDRFPFGV